MILSNKNKLHDNEMIIGKRLIDHAVVVVVALLLLSSRAKEAKITTNSQ